MLMSLKGRLLEKNYRWSVKSSERTGAYAVPALLGLLLFLCVVPAALGQGLSSSTLRGVVKDAGGGLVPNASVKLISSRTGGEREAKTNDEGAYVFTSVEPGPYKLRVEATGFKAYEQSEFMLSPSDTRNLGVTLEVGAQIGRA